MLLQRPAYHLIDWSMLVVALLLTGIGLAFIVSATTNFALSDEWGGEAKRQLVWWMIGLTVCFTALHVPIKQWWNWAWALFALALFMQLFMWAAAGSSLVPSIKGQHNWIALGPLRLQPSEFYKLAVLGALARYCTQRGVDVSTWWHAFIALAIAGVPAIALAKEDLGSALTFLPMALGVLLVAGIRLRHLVLVFGFLVGVVAMGISMLPREGYQWQRIQAWLRPEDYALTTGFQTLRALRSIGSGQWLGKGWGEGDQNRLGWLPEKHTDMIFGIIGEEWGFLRSVLVLLVLLAFGYAGCLAAHNCRDRFGRLLIVGFTGLIMGQVCINLAVVLGLMPVTGITLPFFSYGGSSLLATHLGLGICLAATAIRIDQFTRVHH